MSIKWVQTIREKACNRSAVKVLSSYPRLAGNIGSVCKYGFTDSGATMFYLLEIRGPKGGTKKHVVASEHCRMHDEDHDQSRGSAASQKEGPGDRDAELSMQTRFVGGCVKPSPSANLKKGHSEPKVCWI
jgi:hypothetical protein